MNLQKNLYDYGTFIVLFNEFDLDAKVLEELNKNTTQSLIMKYPKKYL